MIGITANNEGRAVIFAGGISLKADGRVGGALRVRGEGAGQDHDVAAADVTAFAPSDELVR